MPAVAKARSSKHAQTPYTRQRRAPTQKTDVRTADHASKTLFENAAKGLYKLVSWVFTSGEDLSKNLGASASKAVHGDRPKRSQTSQMEDGTLNGDNSTSGSMLSPDLMPHYLGKTPIAVKTRREGQAQGRDTGPAFRVPSFDASQFKIPALPTPPRKSTSARQLSNAQATTQEPARGRSLKSLQIDASTQSRHDAEIKDWLSQQNLEIQDLASSNSVNNLVVEDMNKLKKIMADAGFFRRQGIPPPHLAEQGGQRKATSQMAEPEPRSTSQTSVIRNDHSPSGDSTSTLRSHKIDSRDWQTNTSTGILAAWREICEKQEAKVQNESLSLARNSRNEVGATNRDSTLWHDEISFQTSHQPVAFLESVQEAEIEPRETQEKYWAPVKSYPMPSERSASQSRDMDFRAIASLVSNGRRHTRNHSRQASLARRRRPQKNLEEAPTASIHGTSPPSSENSARTNQSRRPINASRSASRARQPSVEDQPRENKKPSMVDSQVQTGDELMSFLMDDNSPILHESPLISKERRKRPGCFSALDEDMEDMFGPYSDHPTKRNKFEDMDELISRPKIPILHEDDAVKQLRAQQKKEKESMPPPPAVKSAHTTGSNISSTEEISEKQQNSSSNKIPNANVISAVIPPIEAAFDRKEGQASQLSMPTVPLHGSDAAITGSTETSLAVRSSTDVSTPIFHFGHTPNKADTRASQTVESTVPKFSFDANIAKTAPLTTNLPQTYTFGGLAPTKDKQGDIGSEPGLISKSAKMSTPSFGPDMIAKTNFDSNAFISGSQVEPAPFTSTKPVFSFQAPEAKSDVGAFSVPSASEKSNKENLQTPNFNFGSATTKPKALAGATTGFPFDTTIGTGKASLKPFNDPPVSEKNITSTIAPTFSFGAAEEVKSQEIPSPNAFKQYFTSSPALAASSFGKPSLMSTETTSTVPTQPSTSQKPFAFGTLPDSADSIGVHTKNGPGNDASQSVPTKAPGFGFVNQQNVSLSGSAASTPDPPTFSFGTQGQAQTSTSDATSGFGAQPSKIKSSIFDTAPPAQVKSIFGSGGASTQSNGFAFNANSLANNTAQAQTQSTTPTFGQQSAAMDAPQFGKVQNASAPAPPFTASPATTSVPTFTFGATSNTGTPFNNGPGTAGTSAFGNGASTNVFGGNTQNNGMQSSGIAQAPTPASSFQFGETSQTNAPTFAFGQMQSNTNTGFGSPSMQSPSLASANAAPGSPNPFDFSGAPSNNGNGMGNTPRKVLQPRSRRPRNAR